MTNELSAVDIGRHYEVPCAEIRLKDDGRIYHIPVLDHPHADPQFGFPHEHYHIDGRFEIHPRIKHRLEIADGYTRAVILTEGSNTYSFNGLSIQQLRCERVDTGLLFPGPLTTEERMSAYEAWYKGYLGKVCKGRRCPHFGAQMLEKDGKLVCPMHHLTAEMHTFTIIPISCGKAV